MKNSYKS